MGSCAINWGKSGLAPGPSGNAVGQQFGSSIVLDPEQMRKPEYVVYLHTISKRSHEQAHPIYRNVVIDACPKDKRYITFFRVAHPVMTAHVDPDNVSGLLKYFPENAKRVALGICNPSFIGSDLSIQDKPIAEWAQIASQECDLTRQGVFASLNEVPTEEELQKAEARRLAYYKKIFQRMNELWRGDPKRAQEELTVDHHMAAEMFGQDVAWHTITTPKVECPNCGEKIKEGIAFHHSNGTRCILDWERTWISGAIRKDEVPEQFRWWTEAAPKK